MKIDRFLLRGIVICTLATIGMVYEIVTDRETGVMVFYGILEGIGLYLILKVRETKP